MPGRPVDWLLDPSNPAVRFRTLTWLLGKPLPDPDVRKARRAIPRMPLIQEYLDGRNERGLWDCPLAGKRTPVSDPLHERNWTTTLLALTVLAEHGLTKSHKAVDASVSSFLSLMKTDGDFKQPCRNGLLLRELTMMGYGRHPVVVRLRDMVSGTVRWDGGRLCPDKEHKRKTRPTKSCIRASTRALLAFADVPSLRRHPNATRVAQHFLKRDLLYRTDDRERPVRPTMLQTIFPFASGTPSLLETVYGMSRLGYGDRSEIDRAWTVLDSKRLSDGTYVLDQSPHGYSDRTLPEVEAPGCSSRWVTLYALVSQKLAGAWAPSPWT